MQDENASYAAQGNPWEQLDRLAAQADSDDTRRMIQALIVHARIVDSAMRETTKAVEALRPQPSAPPPEDPWPLGGA